MWRRASPRARGAAVVALGAILLAGLNLWWVVTYRRGYPFDIDEAGYTTHALLEYFALKSGGWTAGGTRC